jgi:hypothetical protein
MHPNMHGQLLQADAASVSPMSLISSLQYTGAAGSGGSSKAEFLGQGFAGHTAVLQ